MLTAHRYHPRARSAALYAALSITAVLGVGSREAAAQNASPAPSVGSSSTAESGVPGCDTGWTSPRVLRTPDGRPVYVEAPERVSDTEGTYLLGSPVFVWATPSAFATRESRALAAGAGVRLVGDSSALPLPALPSARSPFTPLAIRRGAALLVLWATSADSSRAGALHQDTLWEAALESGRWTRPRAIWASGSLEWHPGMVSLLALDSTVVVAFPATDTTRAFPHGVTLMTRSGDRWRTRWIGVGSVRPRALASLTLSPSELLVAAVGSIDRDGIRAVNAVYTIRLSIHDTASAPRFALARDMKRMYAEDPSVFRTDAGVHVVWRQPGRKISAADTLVEATSLDRGDSWTVTSAASLESDTRGLRVLPLAHGAGVAAALDIQSAKILILDRGEGRWRLTQQVFADAKTIPTLAKLGDRLRIAFGQTRSSAGPAGRYDAPVLVTVTRALACEPVP